MTQAIPFSAYFELQDRFQYRVGCFNEHSRLSFIFEGMGDAHRYALLNCLTPFQVETTTGLSADAFTEVMLTAIMKSKDHCAKHPLQARNNLDWKRLEALAIKHPQVENALSLLVGEAFSDFLGAYDKERAQVRDASAETLERQVSENNTHLFCQTQKDWLHEATYHQQFSVHAINLDQHTGFTAIGGDPKSVLEQAVNWLMTQNANVMVTFKQFGVCIASADYEDQRIQWRYKLKSTDSTPFKSLDNQQFYEISEAVSKQAALNTNKRAYLSNDLGM